MTLDKKFAGLGLAATALAAPVFAQDAPPAVNTGALSWAAGADIVSSYVFRGYEQEDSGLILQPYVEVSTPLEIAGSVIDFTLGTWNSYHSQGTGETGNGPSRWYESDVYASLGYQINDQFAVSAGYTGYFYPNGSVSSIDEFNFGVSYDDSEAFGDWAFSPYAMLAIETRDAGGTEDIYLEIGGEFGAPFIESEDMPVELSFPFALGFSIDDYYFDNGGDEEFFGYLLVGAALGMPLDFIPSEYGVWSASAGIDLIIANADNLFDNGDDFGVVGKVGVGLEY